VVSFSRAVVQANLRFHEGLDLHVSSMDPEYADLISLMGLQFKKMTPYLQWFLSYLPE
jgi:hypothetical protein